MLKKYELRLKHDTLINKNHSIRPRYESRQTAAGFWPITAGSCVVAVIFAG